MKILMTIPYFVPAWGYGGPVQACFQLSKTLVQQGHEVTVLTTDTLDAQRRVSLREETIEGIQVVRFRNLSNRLAKQFNFFTPMGMGAWLAEHIRQFDVIHCHEFFVFANIRTHKLAGQYSIPFFLQPHGSAVPKPERGRSLIKKLFNAFWGKQLLLKADAAIALTEAEAKDLRDYAPGVDVAIIPNGIEMPSAQHLGEWPYQKYGVAEGTPVVISLGRLHPVKGFDLLLASFARLQQLSPDVRLCLVGPDEGCLQALQAQAATLGLEKNIIFTGLVVGAEKERLLAAASLFALFSRDEPFSIATLEAAAQGLPLVISRHIGLASQVEESAVGKVVDPLAADACAGILHEVLKPEIAYNLKRNLPEFLARYDMNKIARSTAALYAHRHSMRSLR